tara:strand:+ start:74189 stop:74803 length:615 start_codon:yes stop_codon:yes gene_type:complete
MKPILYILTISPLILFISCNEGNQNKELISEDHGNTAEFTSNDWFLKEGEVMSRDTKKVKDVLIGARHVSAIDFLKNSNKKAKPGDLKSLREETVLILEFKSLNKKHRNPLNLDQCVMPYEKGIEHLSFNLDESVEITQDDSVYMANGTHFERDFGLSDRLRIVMFFKGINRKEDFKLSLNDVVFGGGLLNFHFTESLNYSENL